jgi:hypothetical protein
MEELLRLMGWKLTKPKLCATNENTIKLYVLNIHMTHTKPKLCATGLGWPGPILRFRGPRAKRKHGALNFKIKIIINI